MSDESSTGSRSLTIYLVKASYDGPEAILTSRSDIERYTIHVSERGPWHLALKRPKPKKPTWARFFDGYFDINLFGRVASSAAALLVPLRDRWFVVTFGYGRFLLQEDCWEERFGLLVALNALGERPLRSLDKQTFDAISRHTREQASQDVSAQDFGLDIERDLLRAVTGSPEDESLGKSLTGREALNTYSDIDPSGLERLLREVLPEIWGADV